MIKLNFSASAPCRQYSFYCNSKAAVLCDIEIVPTNSTMKYTVFNFGKETVVESDLNSVSKLLQGQEKLDESVLFVIIASKQ